MVSADYARHTHQVISMFHPHFFTGLLSCHTPNAHADSMRLISDFKVEEDLQRTWREEREWEKRDEVQGNERVAVDRRLR